MHLKASWGVHRSSSEGMGRWDACCNFFSHNDQSPHHSIQLLTVLQFVFWSTARLTCGRANTMGRKSYGPGLLTHPIPHFRWDASDECIVPRKSRRTVADHSRTTQERPWQHGTGDSWPSLATSFGGMPPYATCMAMH